MSFEVVLVDDHQILRDCIRAILARHPEFHVAGEARNGMEGVALCRQLKPDLVVMDLELPGMSGLEATSEILRHCPHAKIVILSMRQDEDAVLDAIRCGARSYVLKSASAGDLVEALHAAATGNSYFSHQVSSSLLQKFQQGFLEKTTAPLLAGLTRRETELLRLIASGKVNKEIADLLGIQLATVRTYRKKLMRKAGVRNVAGLTRLALAAGLALSGAPVLPAADSPVRPASQPSEADPILPRNPLPPGASSAS